MSSDDVVYYGLDDMYHSATVNNISGDIEGTDVDSGQPVRLRMYCGEWSEIEVN